MKVEKALWVTAGREEHYACESNETREQAAGFCRTGLGVPAETHCPPRDSELYIPFPETFLRPSSSPVSSSHRDSVVGWLTALSLPGLLAASRGVSGCCEQGW